MTLEGKSGDQHQERLTMKETVRWASEGLSVPQFPPTETGQKAPLLLPHPLCPLMAKEERFSGS